jgi:hypothetical protein
MLHSNIVHRVDAAPHSREAMGFQWREARRIGIPTTTLFTYPALFMDEAIADVEALRGPDDELGLHFHNIACPRLTEKYQTSEPALWLLPQETRARLIDEMMAAFEKRFGFLPRSVGGYIIDAWTLAYLKKNYPSVTIAITSCFEEGVKMFYGNNRNWMLFSDGGPWNPYFPSRSNALIPAGESDEAIDIVAVPHLNRDMIMALSSRDDWFASHPGNILRARVNEGPRSPYYFRFLEAWERQAQLNGWSYLNIFVSSPWMSARHWCVEKVEDVHSLYTQTLEWLKEKEARGAVCNQIMSGFANDFRSMVKPGDATLCHWRDELRQNKREVVWSVNSHHRCAFDMNRGGTLVDFRPYDGRLNGDLGPESPLLYNGNHPFLISTEYCGGHWNTSQHAVLTDGTHSFNIADRRVRASVERVGDNAWIIRTEPVSVLLGEHTVRFQSSWQIGRDASIRISRTLLEYDGDAAKLRLTERFLGRPGTHEYPEDLRGITLRLMDAEGGTSAELPFTYSGQNTVDTEATTAAADIPRLRLQVRLIAESPALEASVEDGKLFTPKFALNLTYPVTPGKEIATCLTTNPLKNL